VNNIAHVYNGQPQYRLTPLHEEPSQISACTVHFQKLESEAYIFVADNIGLSPFKFLCWAPKKRILSAIECGSAIQGRPRSRPRSTMLVPI